MKFLNPAKLFKSVIAITALALSRVNADFPIALVSTTNFPPTALYSVACGSDEQNCDCWESAPETNSADDPAYRFSLAAGLCGWGALDFYYQAGIYWYVYEQDGNGSGVATCHYNDGGGLEGWNCAGLHYKRWLWCTSSGIYC